MIEVRSWLESVLSEGLHTPNLEDASPGCGHGGASVRTQPRGFPCLHHSPGTAWLDAGIGRRQEEPLHLLLSDPCPLPALPQNSGPGGAQGHPNHREPRGDGACGNPLLELRRDGNKALESETVARRIPAQ